MPSIYFTAALFRVIVSIGSATPSLRSDSFDCSSSTSFQGEHHQQVPLGLPSTATPAPCRSQPVRVAIIGGGPAGTSSSFWISEFANRSGNPVELHIFERSNYLGGRSNIIYPFDSDLYPPIEAGASIFVPANKHLHQAVRQFNLTLEAQTGNENYAIWDGTQFAFESSGYSWWNAIKLFWRYGRGPFQLNSLSKQTVDQFIAVYTDQFVKQGPFEELNQWIRAIGLQDHLLSKTASQYLIDEQSVNVQAVNEIAAIMARTNYGQDVNSMHGFGALVSIAGSGGASVQGGNRQIFQKFANHSTAHIHLNHQVTTITQLDVTNYPDHPDLKYVLTYRELEDKSKTHLKSSTDSQPFDAVILAAPYYQTDITILSPNPSTQIPSQPFVKLHVTFIVTNATAPSGQLFNRPENEFMARSIYSTMMKSVLANGQRPLFNSLNYLKKLGSKEGVVGDLYIVKIFSEALMPTDTLSKLFGSSENLIWIKRIEWDAYPMLTPLRRSTNYPPTKLGERFYYVNGFESIISTMETQTVAAWNIAMMLSKDCWNFIPKKSWTSNST